MALLLVAKFVSVCVSDSLKIAEVLLPGPLKQDLGGERQVVRVSLTDMEFLFFFFKTK